MKIKVLENSVLGVTKDRYKDINMKQKWVNHTHVNVCADMCIQYLLVMVIYCRDRGAVKKDMERGLRAMDIHTHTQTYGHTPYIHTYLNSWF